MLKSKKFILSLLGAITTLGMATLNVNAQALTNRVFGQDRIKTSVSVANSGWTKSDYAIIANAWDFPDAVCSAPLAYKYSAPILLTNKEGLTDETSSELSNLQVKHVFIVGGSGVVSHNVEAQIEAKGIDVQRLYGQDRFQTSIAVANQVGTSGSIVITNGYNPYEALSISPIAAKKGMPIILTDRKEAPDTVVNYIKQNNITQTYVLGKADGITDDDGVADNSIFPNPIRITGANPYERNINIIKMFSNDLDFSKVYLASGKAFADALSGSALAATTSSPVIFVDSNMPQVTKDFITSEANSVNNICVLGGTGAISDATVQKVETLLSTPGGNSNTTTSSAISTQ
ncbi:cell wall-binding repeat-containing protein [Clostridiaceae bacterium UIB06]|uniref:Cell wall-binding repeat-containing protein n=1 Tax=Clostridium thailandense TaxID=2794346 RepID=A0A949TK19_9CLOT|nr:cell wall-binding repeat-containing protein [Clostridium thailandense]MBV7273735.1 cell wall-binding repeat-containing protein [Clostridium thailandense]MCH5137485.1 cell wall-binding repeat-containing protein [Clostridiaceae bacterium UIB06]